MHITRLIVIVMLALSIGPAFAQQPPDCEDKEVFVKVKRAQKATLRLAEEELAKSVEQFEIAFIGSPQDQWIIAEVSKLLWQTYVQNSEEGSDLVPPPDDPVQVAVEAAMVLEGRVLLSPSEYQSIRRVGRLLELADINKATGRWADFVIAVSVGRVPSDINSIMQFVIRQAYLETNKDLQFYADKVQYYNSLKSALREEINRARDFSSEFAGLKCE